MRNKWSVLGLGGLALVTLVLMVLALLHVRPQETVAAMPADPQAPRRAVESPTPTPSAAPGPQSSLRNIRSLVQGEDPASIVVVGDTTGADDRGADRWVTRWATELSAERPVSVRTMGSGGVYAAGERLGRASGAPLEIYNASGRPGELWRITADAHRVIPREADLVILNVGREESASAVKGNLDALRAELPEDAMTLVVLQNPERGDGSAAQQQRVRAVREWAEAARLPTVNVYAAFLNHPRPMRQLLTNDGTLPNDVGSEVWTEAMSSALADA